MAEHRLGAQESRAQGERRDAGSLKVPGHGIAQAVHRALRQVVEQLAAIALVVAVRDLDDQPRPVPQHQGRRMLGGDQVAEHRLIHQRAHHANVEPPELGAPIDHRVAAPDVVDQDVQPAPLGLDAGHQGDDFVLLGVIGADRDAHAAVFVDQRRGLLDRLGPTHGRGLARAGPAGAVDHGPRRAEHAGDAPARAARGAGDERHFPVQRSVHRAPPAFAVRMNPSMLFVSEHSFIN